MGKLSKFPHKQNFHMLTLKNSEVFSDQFFTCSYSPIQRPDYSLIKLRVVKKESDSGCAGLKFQSALQNMLQSVQNQVKCCYNLEITTSSEGSECLIQFYLCLMSGSHCFIATALQCARTKNRLENEGFRERFRKQKPD